MTNEELLSVAEIVEKLTDRFNAQAALHRERFDEHVKLIASMKADHETKMVEHRAAFGARTEADAKIIAGLRSEIGAAQMAVLERDSLISERDGLLTQVQDMRVEINRLQWENMTMHKDAEDGYTEAIKVLGDPIALSKERDALRAEVADLRGIVDMVHASLGIKRGDHIGNAIAQLKAQTPKRSHPVAVGEYLRRLTGFSTTPAGEVAQVLHVDCDAPTTEYTVKRPNGQQGVWSESGCEPCDPPATIKREPKIGDTVRLVTHPERAKVAEHLQIALQWPWMPSWGLVGQTGKVVKPLAAVAGAVAVALDGSTIFARWPIACLEVVAEATHDTEAGKAAAESALKTEPVAEEIKVGDMAKVVGASGDLTAQSDIGKIGEVLKLGSMDGTVLLSGGAGWVDHRDVRKVTP